MSKLSDKENNYTFVPKNPDIFYPVPLRKWNRIKTTIKSIPDDYDKWAIGLTLSFGASTTCVGVLLSSASHKALYLALTVCFFIVFLAVLYFSFLQKKNRTATKALALDRMLEIEEDHKRV